MQLPVILPHLTVEYLLRTRKVVVCQADVEEYWSHLQGAKVQWALDHPGAFSCAPLGIYGDEGQISKSGDKVMVITFNFVLDNRAGDGVIHRFPIATLREWCSLGMRSMHPLSQVMAWSFNVPPAKTLALSHEHYMWLPEHSQIMSIISQRCAAKFNKGIVYRQTPVR